MPGGAGPGRPALAPQRHPRCVEGLTGEGSAPQILPSRLWPSADAASSAPQPSPPLPAFLPPPQALRRHMDDLVAALCAADHAVGGGLTAVADILTLYAARRHWFAPEKGYKGLKAIRPRCR